MLKHLAYFSVGAAVYPLLEIAWRGNSHWSMAVAGGLCLDLLAALSRRPGRLRRKCLHGAGLITAVELVCGLVVNKALHWSVWDYSHLPINLWGQICLPFTCLWFLLCIPVLALLRRVERGLLSRRSS